MTLFSKSYISYGVRCKSFVCVIKWGGAVCIFSRTDRSWARLYRVFPKKSAKSTVIEYTQAVLLFCAGEMRIHYFSGQVFFVCISNKNGHRVG